MASIEKQVGGLKFVFGHLAASENLDICMRIQERLMSVHAAAARMKAAAGGIDLDKDVTELMPEEVQKLITAGGTEMAMTMTKVLDTDLIRRLCSVVGGPKVGLLTDMTFENFFAGRPVLAIEIAVESFKVNGGPDFFARGVALVGGLMPKKDSIQAKPTSTGGSGA